MKNWLGNKLLTISLKLLPKISIPLPEKTTREVMQYRVMIIKLLEYWDKPIPQNVRKKAYDLLDEYATEQD